MHMQRRTRPSKDIATSKAQGLPPAMRLKGSSPSRFAETVSAARVTPRPDVAAYQKGYRDCAERSRALMLELAHALEDAMASGWPDEAEPRNAEWRRLIWRAQRTPK